MRTFNIAGPVKSDIHYCLPPLHRLDEDEVLGLIDTQKYFVLHAPRQTGKTSCLLALVEYLNSVGNYRAVYANMEPAQAARENVERAMHTIIGQIGRQAARLLGDSYVREHRAEAFDDNGPEGALNAVLSDWAASSPLPIVLMLDEIDSLVGDTLISVLRQLRAGYDQRPKAFPQSVILCGVRDVRDYRLRDDTGKSVIAGGSAFNIKSKSLRLGDFSREDLETLYTQHTEETGQAFELAALNLAWQLTQGQPWLVNALANEACFEMPEGKDRSRPITADLIDQARENLIMARVTHLDQLADKLREDRVRRVIEPILTGEPAAGRLRRDDLEYVQDLGLIRLEGQVRIANPIYMEVIPRELTYDQQVMIGEDPAWYIERGLLDMNKLLVGFQQFFRENSEVWSTNFDYHEAWPHLLLMAFLQRIVNHGGRIHREYAVGRGRMDLLVEWPAGPKPLQRFVLELKIVRDSPERRLAQGLQQTAEYMDLSGDVEGHLILFDQRPNRTWDERIYRREETAAGKAISVWGM